MHQPDLCFDAPAVWRSDTSRAAAESIRPTAQTLRNAVLLSIAARGDYGATDEELQVALSMNPSTQRPRRVELCDAGKVADSGRTRRTRSGRAATVWVAV